MFNPFEQSEATFIVLQNHMKQYSLWPAYIDIPAGWAQQFGPAQKERCEAYIEQHWQDVSPVI